jgi:ribosome assembly protein 1
MTTGGLSAKTGKKHEHDLDFDSYVETGFQLAIFQGPLCAEPVEGLAYFVENLEIDIDGTYKEIGISVS